MDNEFLFSQETALKDDDEHAPHWKIALIDDDEMVHKVSVMAMKQIHYAHRGLEFIHAYSAEEAKQLLADHPDTALVLLDVVMEENDSGLKIVEYIRNVLKNPFTRIILRTGQPGYAPERDVILNYDINDYKEKSELTADKLYTTVIAALRTYESLMRLDKSRDGLTRLIKSTNHLFKAENLDHFVTCLLDQVLSLTGMEKNAFYGRASSVFFSVLDAGNQPDSELRVINGIGDFKHKHGQAVKDLVSDDIMQHILAVQESQHCFYSCEYSLIIMNQPSNNSIIYIEGNHLQPDQVEQSLLELLGSEASIACKNVKLNDELDETLKEIIYMLGTLAESRSGETAQHVVRVAHYTALLAEKYGLPHYEVEMLRLASPMHDLGKIAIPDSILNKPGKLTAEEFEIMKTHTTVGYQSLNISDRKLFKAAAIIAHQHQEKWNGKGYPQGLQGEQIHLYARITAVADVFDALGTQRCYKPAWDIDRILTLLKAERGEHFEPKLIDLFLDNLDEILHIRKQYQD